MGDASDKYGLGAGFPKLSQTYSVNYQFKPDGPRGVVKSVKLTDLLSRYGDIL